MLVITGLICYKCQEKKTLRIKIKQYLQNVIIKLNHEWLSYDLGTYIFILYYYKSKHSNLLFIILLKSIYKFCGHIVLETDFFYPVNGFYNVENSSLIIYVTITATTRETTDGS